MKRYDVLVIGSGKGGKTLAMKLASDGASVGLIERKWIGGSCINVACIPTKTLVKTAKVAELLRNAASYGVVLEGDRLRGEFGLDMQAVLRRKRGVVEQLVDRNKASFARSGVELLVGQGRFVGEDRVLVDFGAVGAGEGQKGEVEVDERLRTSNPRVWGVGDVTGGLQFTHVSWDDYRVLYSNLSGGDRITKGRLVPYTLFTDPELGRVGLTEDQARAKGKQIRVAKLPASAIPRAMTSGETRGLLKAVIDQQTDEILGVSILCAEAGEILATIQVAMLSGMKASVLRDVIFSHPTMAEAINDWLYR